ncbi:MAG TPA: hypothetical protein VHH33_01520 [Nitrososphaeraceae archaeon]|nr:hypothetical protein [Nitrososphaeraceae archaeon]
MLDDKLQRLQSKISDISTRKSEGQEDSNKLKRLLDYSFYFSAWSRN